MVSGAEKSKESREQDEDFGFGVSIKDWNALITCADNMHWLL